MAKKWSEVTANPAYQALPPEEQEAARQEYFESVVSPQVPAKDLDLARTQFMESTATARNAAPGLGLQGYDPDSPKTRFTGPNIPIKPVIDDTGVPNIDITPPQEAPPVQASPTQLAQLQQAFEEKKNNPFSRIGDAWDRRKAMAGDIIAAKKRGEIGPIQQAYQGFGKVGLGMIGDVTGEVFNDVGKVLAYNGPDEAQNIPTPFSLVKDSGSTLSHAIGNLPAYGGGTIGEKIPQELSRLREDHPNAMRNADATANILGLVAGATPVKGVSAIGAAEQALTPIAKAGTQLAVQGADKAINKLAAPSMVMPNAEQLAQLGVKSYEAARKSGEVFDPKTVTNKFVGAIESAKPSKIGGTVETELSKDLESALGKYKELTNRPLSIDEVDIIDKDLGNLKDQAYSAGKNQFAGELANIQNSLRGSVSESPSGKTLAEARDMFRRKYQMDDVERIFRNAEGRPNEAAIIQTGYRNLANQARKKGSGYSKEQIKIMDKVAKGGMSIDALKLASSRLIPIAAGASGGPIGAGVAYMGNVAAAAGATALQTAKANKLAKSITKGLSVPSEPTIVNRLASKLKKADIQKAFEDKKSPQLLLAAPDKMSGIPMTEAQIKISQAKMRQTEGKTGSGKSVDTQNRDYGLTPSQVASKKRLQEDFVKKKEKSLPRSEYLNEPDVPSAEMLKKHSRVESVPLGATRSHQSKMRWDEKNKGKHGEELIKGYGDKPVAIRLENGEYIIVDGNHRTVDAINSGKKSLEMTVIDAKTFDPANAGRKKVKDNTDIDELLKQLKEK